MPDQLSLLPSPEPPRAPGTHDSLSGGAGRWQLRLIVSVPTLLVLVILAFGLVSYLTFLAHWPELEKAGAGALAGSLLRIHMITMIVLSVVAALMGIGLCATILRPIRALVETARMVALGRLDQRAPHLPAARELDDLSHSFNAMIDNLNRSIAERNRCLMEGIPIGVMTTDMAGRVGAISPMAADILGVEADRLIGHRIAELKEILPAPSHVLVESLLGLIREGEAQTAAEILLSSDGGQKLSVTSSILRDSAGRPYGVLFSFRESIRIHGLSDQLSRTDQLAALGTFTLGLAHELRNPLGAIKGLSQLLLLEQSLPLRAAEFLGRMTREVDRVDTFLHQLFELSEQPVACLMPTSLAAVVQKANELARGEIAEEKANAINLEFTLEPMPPLMLEGDRLIVALAKIIYNAYETTPPGGTITLRTRRERTGAGPSTYRVGIRNTGSTIEPENIKRLVEPFFTTKGKVTGLGLTIANQIIIQNGGRLEVSVGPDEVTFEAIFDEVRMAEASAKGAAQGGQGR